MSTSTSQDQSLDYQHFIDYQLTRAQGRMKSVEIGTAFVRLMTAVLVYFVVVIGLDHALVLPSGLRLVLLLAALAAGLGYFGVAVVLPSWRRINHFYTARTIEQATPEFKNSLMNFLDLRRRPEELPAGVLSLLEERAVADLSNVQVEEKINQDRLIKASYGLAATVLVTCAAVLMNALIMQRSLIDSLGRVIFPTADIQPPTQTRLTEIKPGDKTIVAHTAVTVSAIADGREPAQVSLYWSDDGGRFWREQPLKKPESGSQFDPWTTQLLVEKPLQYYLAGGDCRTKEFTIEVTQPPMVTELELIYDYPEYTGWAQYTSRNGNIDALEGTSITLTATTSRPVSSGQIRFGSTKSMGPALQTIVNRPDQLTGKFSVIKNDTYVIWFVTADGETNPRPASYEIKVRTDLPPTVTVKPGIDQVDPPVPANAIVPIGVIARDDFGIDEVKLNIGRGQETVQSFDLTDLQSPGKELNTTHRLDLDKLRLGNGYEITYWVDVADNRQPKRNRVSSPHYRIRLGSPLSPTDRDEEEKRQVQLARAEDAERAADAAEKAADDASHQPGTSPSDKSDPAAAPDEPAPKDERALDVIRKYLQEKDRAEQTEQPRESPSDQDAKPAGDTEPGESKDPNATSKQEGNNSGDDKAAGRNTESKSEAGQESNRDDRSASQNAEDKASGNRQSGQKPGGEKSGQEKTKGESAGKEKSDEGKSESDKSDPGDTGESNDTPRGQNMKQSEKSGDKTSSDQKQRGDKSNAERSDDDQPGEPKSKGDRTKSEKSGSGKPEDAETGERKNAGEGRDTKKSEKSHDQPSSGQKQPADKSDTDPPAGAKPGDAKPGDESAKSDKSSSPATKGQEQSKGAGSRKQQSRDGEPNLDKNGEDKANGEKPAGEKGSTPPQSGNKKAGGEKSADEKATDDKQDRSGSADKPAGDDAAEKTAENSNGKFAGSREPTGKDSPDKTADSAQESGGKPGGQPKDGDKGAEKTGANKSSGNTAGKDSSKDGSSKKDAPGAGQPGDKPNGDQQSAGKPGGDNGSGTNSGADKGTAKGSGNDQDSGKADDDAKASDKQSERDANESEKPAAEKQDGAKSDGAKSDDGKSGNEKPNGGQQAGDKKSGSGAPKGTAQGSPGKSDRGSESTGKGSTGSTPGSSNPSGERTEKPQPGGGANPGEGPIRKNDPTARQTPPTPNAPTPDYSNEGSELVLDRLAKQLDKGQVDPELLQRLGWTRDELEQFVKEFQGPGATDADPSNAVDKSKSKKPTERGKTTLDEKRVRSTRRGPGQTAVDTLGENYEGRRSKPAPEYEDHVRAYNMSQSKSDKASAPAGTGPK